MTTTTDRNGNDFAGDTEATAEVPRPALPPQTPQAPYGYGPYAAPQPAAWTPGYAPYGPQAPVPSAPQRGLTRNGRIAVAGGAAALVAAMVGVVVIGAHAGGGSTETRRYAPPADTNATAEADPGAKVLAAADLPQLLLNPAEVAGAVGMPGSDRIAQPQKIRTQPYADKLASNQSCLPLAYAGEQDAYQGTGFSSMRGQFTMAKGGDDPQNWFYDQTVFAYPTKDAAEKAMLKNVATFKACEGQSWSVSEPSDAGPRTIFWNAGTVQQRDALVIAPITQENAEGWGCWRGLTTDANVVIDFTVCALDKPATVPAALADTITKKLPTT